MTHSIGLYVHVPFCMPAKCPYCDFYSVRLTDTLAKRYTQALKIAAHAYAKRLSDCVITSIYFGGGTPTLLEEQLTELLTYFQATFHVASNAEITVEANPGGNLETILPQLHAAGFNRLSLGMQSASDMELCSLGRKHTMLDTAHAVSLARKAGFDNLSLDLMLATPGQTIESALHSVEVAVDLAPEHISAYLLHVEPGTPYALQGIKEAKEDLQADCYLSVCKYLEAQGYAQYEISNFAKPGRHSRHNLCYWNDEEYLGLGPGAHSFLSGRRFFYPRDIQRFIDIGTPEDEGPGGSFSEYVMLRLRLKAGLLKKELQARFGLDFSVFDKKALQRLEAGGFLHHSEEEIALTCKGFLLSNAVIGTLLS